MNLEKLNLVEISSDELIEIDGGNFFKKFTWAYLASQVVDNWDDIKSGFSAGYSAGNR